MSVSAIQIKVLGPDDTGVMRRMLKMFGAAFDDPSNYCRNPPSEPYLRDMLASETFIAIAATGADDVVGGLAAYLLRKFEQERSEVYLYDLAVAAAHRRQGIATALIDALRREAVRHGAHVVFVQADPEDEPAVALYAKLGSRADVLHFDIAPVGGAVPP